MRKNRLFLLLVTAALLLSTTSYLFYNQYVLHGLDTETETIGCSTGTFSRAQGFDRGVKQVYQTFIPHRETINSVSVFVNRESSSYNLQVEITELNSFTSLGGGIVTIDSITRMPTDNWVTIDFSNPIKLKAWNTYKIEFIKIGGSATSYWYVSDAGNVNNKCYPDGYFLYKYQGRMFSLDYFDMEFRAVLSGPYIPDPNIVTPPPPPPPPSPPPGETPIVVIPGRTPTPTVKPNNTGGGTTAKRTPSPTVRPVTPTPDVYPTYEPTYEPTEEPTYEPTIEPTIEATPEPTEGGIRPIYIIIGLILLLLLIAFIIYWFYKRSKDDGQPPSGYIDETPIVPPPGQDNNDQGQVNMTGELIPNAPEGLIAPVPNGQQTQDQASVATVPIPPASNQEAAPTSIPPVPVAATQEQQNPQNPNNVPAAAVDSTDMEI